MPKFSRHSRKELYSCDSRIITVLEAAIDLIDFKVLQGTRTKEEQNRLFEEGKSKLRYPNSKHNNSPSLAVDIAPYPVDWEDTRRFDVLAGIVLGVAYEKDIRLRWGGDWDGDFIYTDQKFHDLGHFELILSES